MCMIILSDYIHVVPPSFSISDSIERASVCTALSSLRSKDYIHTKNRWASRSNLHTSCKVAFCRVCCACPVRSQWNRELILEASHPRSFFNHAQAKYEDSGISCVSLGFIHLKPLPGPAPAIVRSPHTQSSQGSVAQVCPLCGPSCSFSDFPKS